jgi:hypothetical protein
LTLDDNVTLAQLSAEDQALVRLALAHGLTLPRLWTTCARRASTARRRIGP